MPNLARSTLLLVAMASPAVAETTIHETVVHDTTTKVNLKLDSSTVLCSAADYGALFLKVLIPELAPLTLLDHQNTGAGAPCVAAGPCEPGNMPSDILDGEYPTTAANINVKAIRVDEADSTAQTCTTLLREEVAVTIRGIPFTHVRYASLGERPFADCAQPPPAPVPEPKTDTYPASDDKVSAGGCAAGGGGAGLLLAFGAFAFTSRRASRARRARTVA